MQMPLPAKSVSSKVDVLVVADSARAALVRQAFRDSTVHVLTTVEAGSDLGELMRRHKADAVIVACDELDRALLARLGEASRSVPVVVFVQRSDDATARDAVAAGISSYVVDGLVATRVRPILDVAIARFQAFHTLRRELDDVRASLADRKIVDRAKGILMQQRSMSEDEAYKALRKMAMDQGRKLADVAQSVVSLADLLKR